VTGPERVVGPRGRAPALCVFCSSSERIDPGYVELAARVGSAVAERGWQLISGGGSVSMMGAVARAARAGGAHTLGVIPRALEAAEVADQEADELVVTAGMRDRKGLMDQRADAFLTLPGGIGTLEELLEIWVARSLGMHGKPVVVLDPDGLFAPLRLQVDALVAAGFVREAAAAELVWTSTVPEAFEQLAAGLAAAVAPESADGVPHGREEAEEYLEAQP
jgi:uncharacterized protein (TIGR00730 family)